MTEEEILEKFKIFGQNIRKIREGKGLTIQELALQTGIKEKYLKKMENGKAKRISMSHIYDIANCLNILPGDLCEGI